MSHPLRIVILEDQRFDAELMAGELSAGGLNFDWRRVDTEAGFRQALESPPDLILADYHLPDFDANAALSELHRRGLDIPFIVVSGVVDEATALKTIALGATDYLFKDHIGRLTFAVERALEAKRFRDRHRAMEGEFRQEMEKYREFVEGTEDLVVQTDTEGRYLFANRMAEKFLGLPPERCLGLSAFDFVHPEDRERTRASFAEWLRGRQEHVVFRNRVLSRRGETFHLSWTINLHYDPQGRLLHLNAIAQDSTEQKRLEHQLQDAIRRYESILEASPAAIYALAPDGTVLSWNRAAERIFGWTPEEAIGSPNPLVPAGREREFRENMQQVLGGVPIFQKELVRSTRDGRRIDISLSAAPLRDDRGRVAGVMAVIFDITERRQLEADRQRKAADLAERIKELNCLFRLTDLINTPDLPAEVMLQRAVDLLPAAFQFPESACARIRVPQGEYLTGNFAETSWRLAAAVAAHNAPGVVEVFYRDEKPSCAEGPFLEEERHLLDAFAERIGSFLHRRETTQSLRALRLRQQHLLETSPAIMFSASASPPYGTTFISGNIRSLLGYEPERFLNNPTFWYEQIHPEDQETALEARRNLRVGETITGEYRVRHGDGSWRWMLEAIRLLGDSEGRPVEYVGSRSEITARKRAEAELIRLNRTLRVLSRCNETLVRSGSEEDLVNRILRILVDSGYPVALVWLPGTEEEGFRPVIQPKQGQEFFDAMVSRDCHLTRNIAGICRERSSRGIRLEEELLACGQCIHCRELAEALRLRSAFSLCLGTRDAHIGCLVIFSTEEAFIPEEIDLLKELADDLAFGIGSLRTEAAHREAQEFLRLRNRALEASSNGIMISEAQLPEMPVIYVNRAFEEITGYSSEEMLGRNPRLLSGRDQKQPGLVDIRACLEEGRPCRALVRNYRKDGELFWNDLSIAPVRDAAGTLTHFVSVINDVTERKRYEEELERRSNFDSLTGLANRNLLSDRIRQGIAHGRRTQMAMAVMLLDLDRFQIINDSLGHSAGNELLKRVAERLEAGMRAQDTLARIGGDEFVLLLQEIERRSDLHVVLEKIRGILSEPFSIGSRNLRITASIGISLFPEDGEDEETLLRNADLAMYHAKEMGRDSFQFFAAEMDVRVMETMDLEADLRQAIERQELILHFQPKVDVASGKIVGSEALVRWQHPRRGMVSPGAFIPLAEETGLIEPIGEWVLREACRTNRSFQEAGLPPVTVAINISARQFRNERLAERVGDILEETGMEARWLDLELTESMLMDRPERAAATMNRLKEIGISLSLDDFGTGYSSLNYLRRFPIDTLKIDRTFIADVESDPGSASVANSIIDIAHNLQIQAVAEGVETAGQLEFLRRCSCDTFQGFFFSRPAPPEQFAELLRESALSN